MTAERLQRRLAAILSADVVGYSRLVGADEAGTVARLKALRRDLIDPKIAAHSGRIVKLMGDGALVEFGSAVDAVSCAIEIQKALRAYDFGKSEPIQLRIGINVGDIIIDGDDILGDGVNVAARIEGIAASGGISISEDAWRQVHGKVTANFADSGEHSLKNIARPVRVYRIELDAGGTLPPVATAPAAPEKPSIAVLPFQNMSGDAEQDYFCDGLVEDIITTLSKLGGLRVIARNSTFVYKGRSVDIREAAKQLGVRYVLEGSVRKSGSRIRITAQLIDAKDGTHVWAERYDRGVDDIFAIQDEITLVLATEMQVKLTEGEQARLRYTTTHNVEAWTYWVQGLALYHQAITKDNTVTALRLWEKALALEPNSASLHAMLGFLHSVEARFGWADQKTAIAKARAYADRALELDPNNADAYITSSVVNLRENHDAAVADARKAIALAPSAADVASLAAFVLTHSGYPDEGLIQAEKSMALNPNYPAVYLGIVANAYRLTGRSEEAIAAFKAYHARSPGFGLADLVLTYQDMGRAEEAKQAARQLLAARPDFTIAAWFKTQSIRRDTVHVERDAAALRVAGLPAS
ncbi:MAG TPA: adenylate/guanylate cyclase domain-containing protein [Xanthobacteraceae bacterium]|jgi:adenylate cyclase|nr:adenylate/guanylate cyclase domain-containing protein [Xanthobacteraceae bacterium]